MIVGWESTKSLFRSDAVQSRIGSVATPVLGVVGAQRARRGSANIEMCMWIVRAVAGRKGSLVWQQRYRRQLVRKKVKMLKIEEKADGCGEGNSHDLRLLEGRPATRVPAAIG